MIDLKLNSEHDLFLKSGDLVLVSGANLVAQQIKITLLTFLGEWFMNTAIGIPYIEQILVKPADKSKLENIFRKKILSVDGVKKVSSVNALIDRANRVLVVEFEAETEESLVRDSVVIGAK